MFSKAYRIVIAQCNFWYETFSYLIRLVGIGMTYKGSRVNVSSLGLVLLPTVKYQMLQDNETMFDS